MTNEKLIKLLEKRSQLSQFITGDDPTKLKAMAEWLDLCIEINYTHPDYKEKTISNKDIKLTAPVDDIYIPIKEKTNNLTFMLPDEDTENQKSLENNRKIEEDLDKIKSAWLDFKKDYNKIIKKHKKKDNIVLTLCFTGIAICSVALIILQWGN